MAKSRSVKREIRLKTSAPVNSWWPRFWAWLIDVLILSLIISVLLPSKTVNWWEMDTYQTLASGLVVFLYWAITDSDGRQSIGKKALGLKLVNKNGSDADLKSATISAFGKAFLLPVDFLIGILARPGKKQRLFNIVSDTVVVRME